MAGTSLASREAYAELLALLRELDDRYLGPEWSNQDHVSEGHRCVLHALLTGLNVVLEADPERPRFERSAAPNMKHTGDNADALYYVAYIRPDRSYRIRANTAGAVYTSLSLEAGSDGHRSTGVLRVINDTELGVAADGSYEIFLGPRRGPGRWFELDPRVGQVQTRHYFEEKLPSSGSIAAGIRRVVHYLKDLTIAVPPRMQPGRVPAWVSTVPNRFNPPGKPAREIGQSAQDAIYAHAPYALGPDEALVIEGRFPRCRYASVALWNHYLMTYDYVTRPVSLNRAQTVLEPDGSFRIAVAHRDPGLPNWLDTEGRPTGSIFWRFFLPEEPLAPLATRVVPFSELARG